MGVCDSAIIDCMPKYQSDDIPSQAVGKVNIIHVVQLCVRLEWSYNRLVSVFCGFIALLSQVDLVR